MLLLAVQMVKELDGNVLFRLDWIQIGRIRIQIRILIFNYLHEAM